MFLVLWCVSFVGWLASVIWWAVAMKKKKKYNTSTYNYVDMRGVYLDI